MHSSPLTRYVFWSGEILLLAATLVAAVLFVEPAEWHPAALVLLVLGIALMGQRFSVGTSAGELSASLVAIVLAMGLLGPGPAAACGIAAGILTSYVRRVSPAQWLNNLSGLAAVPFVAGLLVRFGAERAHLAHTHSLNQNVTFALILFGAFMIAVGLNFALFALDVWIEDGRSFRRQVSELFLPLLSGQLTTGMIATVLAVSYKSVGLPALLAAIAVLLLVQRLTVALLRSEERAEQLEIRGTQMARLQWGVVKTLGSVLGVRDKTGGRHGAAVARYAAALAAELGCDEQEREDVHSAGLFHEIGKYSWPDRVLQADVLGEEEMSYVRKHPQDGALLVGAIDGYGAVADAILYHHERFDGTGYPAGLIGNEIPLASRIIAICSAYDAMTAGEGYRAEMSPQEAMEELRHGARNGQFDGELVETFLKVLEQEGPTFAKEADFEAEINLERRVERLAAPRPATDTSSAAGRRRRQPDLRRLPRQLRERVAGKH